MLAKGSTAMAGRSGSGKAGRARLADLVRRRRQIGGDRAAPPIGCCTSPTKRSPLRAMVRISFWSWPLSPTRLARGVDAAGQCRIRHDPAVPDRRDEIVLADDAIAVLDQANQQIEHLRLDGNGLGSRGAARAGRYQAYDRQREIARCCPRRFAKPSFAQKRPYRGKSGLRAFLRLACVVCARAGSRSLAHIARIKKFRKSPEKINAARSAASSLSCGAGLSVLSHANAPAPLLRRGVLKGPPPWLSLRASLRRRPAVGVRRRPRQHDHAQPRRGRADPRQWRRRPGPRRHSRRSPTPR